MTTSDKLNKIEKTLDSLTKKCSLLDQKLQEMERVDEVVKELETEPSTILMFERFKFKEGDQYFNIIKKKIPVLAQDITTGTLKYIGFFAGIDYEGKVLVCDNIVCRGKEAEIIRFKRTSYTKNHIVNRIDYGDQITDAIILSISGKDYYNESQRVAKLKTLLFTLKIELHQTKEELQSMKDSFDTIYTQLKNTLSDLIKYRSKLNIYETERARLIIKISELSNQLNNIKSYASHISKLLSETNSVIGVEFAETINDSLQKIDQLHSELLKVVSDPLVDMIKNAGNVVSKISNLGNQEMNEKLDQLSSDIEKLKELMAVQQAQPQEQQQEQQSEEKKEE